ncbi:MAG: hypothetical protein ABJN61_07915 [Flavobacteriaceae bacterium]|uniref:hypothetical protein n=1 Tax=Nonlabens ulvanivorans TaxID=906888 RepID=UPI00329831B5
MKKITYFFLALCFIQCGRNDQTRNNSETKNNTIENSDSEKEDKRKFVDIEPILTTDSTWVYDFQGIKYEAEPNSKISYYDGPDFRVHTLILKGNDTVGMYQGWHPQAPSIYSFAFRRGLDDIKDLYLQKAINNQNHFIKKERTVIEYDEINDSTINPIWDTMYLEIYTLKNTNIWISKPLENKSGSADVTVEFKADSVNTKYHFFGQVESISESQKMIELAKQLK